MRVFGKLDGSVRSSLEAIEVAIAGLHVTRSGKARSSTPFPKSTDLEGALRPLLGRRGFQHHTKLTHPRTGVGFEYDFWRPTDGVALEVMGYRADDEIYKDLLKFHVHEGTRVGVVLVPRWKWVSGKRQDRNYSETMKALAFADSFMTVEALVAITYDWASVEGEEAWSLKILQTA